MAMKFEFHMVNAEWPNGMIPLADLNRISASLQSLTSQLGRGVTNASQQGRLPKEAQELANFMIGIENGSTSIVIERQSNEEYLIDPIGDDIDARFNEQMMLLWDGKTSADNTGEAKSRQQLIKAFSLTGASVEFKSDGESKFTLSSSRLSEIAASSSQLIDDFPIAVVQVEGMLSRLDISKGLLVTDNSGHSCKVNTVDDPTSFKDLFGTWVRVSGVATKFTSSGYPSQLEDATIEATQLPFEPVTNVGLEDLLSAPRPAYPGTVSLSADEADEFIALMMKG
ncbi:hypothetical protein [Arcanobacterium ihumii]|uniref:hypothetical protein n=1 Tax=Arcanobacterium ihumii TaxID=2138162 RepID=UPI000F5419B3|nr:hypothetical protein [Arcanobacterium ihumii]